MSDADSDELEVDAPDYRFLPLPSRSSYALPARGDKDALPDGTRKQDALLQTSRQALYDAIAVERVLPVDRMHCLFDPLDGTGIIHHPKGPLFHSVGRSIGLRNACRVLPEEVLFLLERGSIVCTLPDDPFSLPLPVQAVYAYCLAFVSLEKVQVYSHLKRAGFHVLRAAPQPATPAMTFLESWTHASRRLAGWWQRHQSGPLSRTSVYRSFDQVYNQLAMSPYHDPRSKRPTHTLHQSAMTERDEAHQVQVCYAYWKPGTAHFRKSAPGQPDGRLAVCSAAGHLPSLAEMDALLEAVPLFQGETEKMTMREGWRETLVLAVVDAGVMNFIKLCDVSFALQHKAHSQ